MEPLEATLFRVTVDWPDFWIDIFQLVIRLSKAKQLAFRLRTIFGKSCCSYGPIWPFENCVPTRMKPVWTAKNLIFTAAAQAFRISTWQDRQQACPLPAGVVSLVFGEVKHIVHLIRWNSYSRFMPLGLTWLPSRQGNNARPLGLVEPSPFNLAFSFFTN